MVIKTNNKKLGFTLLEMVVATAIFAIVMVVYVGIYLATVRANSQITVTQKVQNELRYILESISREVRLGSIDYDFYEGTWTSQNTVLAIKDNSDNNIYFRGGLSGANGVAQMSYDYNSWVDLSTDNLIIDELFFYVIPETDPFVSMAQNARQPGVLIYLSAHHKKDTSMIGSIKIQTFISSRQYKK